jgi:hypothetical protein
MRTTHRVLALVGVAAAALVVAANALANPLLYVDRVVGDTAFIQFAELKADAAPLKVSIYSAPGYTAVASAPGTQIGTVHADLQALAISPDAIIMADGTITTDDPTKAVYVTNQCSPGTHTAVWLLTVTVTGQTITVPMYIDVPPMGDPLAGSSPIRMVVCFSSPYIPAAQGGAPFGAKIINAALTLNKGTLKEPTTAGPFVWRTIVTPYTVGGATPNPAGTVEARAIVETGTPSLSITTKVVNKKKRIVRVTGVLKDGTASPVSGADVLLAGTKLKATTSSTGSVSFTVTVKKKGKATFQLLSSVSAIDVTSAGCQPATPGIPCVSATANGFDVKSRKATVKV